MDFNKVLFLAVLGFILIIFLDVYDKYDTKKREDDLKQQALANQTMIQLQKMQGAGQQGFLGNLLSNIPLIGGLF